MRTLAVAQGVAWRTLHNFFHEQVAAHPVAGLPAVLLHRLRRRPLGDLARARVRLPGRLHGVPVRVRAAPVGGVRAACSPASASPATSRAASRGGCCSRRRTAAASCSATRSAALVRWFVDRLADHGRRLRRADERRRKRRRPVRPLRARRSWSTSPRRSGPRASRCGSARCRRGRSCRCRSS